MLSSLKSLDNGNQKPVVAVDRFGSCLFALTENSVDVYNFELENVGHFNLKGFSHMLVDRNRLVLGNKYEIVIFSISEHMITPKRVGSFQLESGVAGLLKPPAGSSINLIFILNINGGGRMFDITEANAPQEVANFIVDPWFARGVQIGNRLVIIRTDKNSSTSGYLSHIRDACVKQIAVGR